VVDYAIEVYSVKTGLRAKIGEVCDVPAKGGGTERKVVTSVLTTETHPNLESLGRDVSEALAGICVALPEVVGPPPPNLVIPVAANAPDQLTSDPTRFFATDAEVARVANAAAAFLDDGKNDAPSEELLQHPDRDGHVVAFDRRRIHLLVALDRKMENFVDRRARAIWQELSGEGIGNSPKGVTEAVGIVARRLGIKMTPREGYELAQREAYRLGMQIALISSRSMVPPADQLP
jgi:hypothetical protein